MQTYVKPQASFVTLASDENFAAVTSTCHKSGVCHWPLEDGTIFWPYTGNQPPV